MQVPKQEHNSIQLSDEDFKCMIEEVFCNAPTQVEVVRAVLGLDQKDDFYFSQESRSPPGKSGRLPEMAKTKMTVG
jgi:hypothetical protein